MNFDRQETAPEQAADLRPAEQKGGSRKPEEKTEKPRSVLKELQTRKKILVKKPKASEKDPDIEEELQEGQKMENDIQVFQNEKFGTIRVVEINEEPWFAGRDVATVLGYSNSRKSLADHVDEEDKRDGVTIRDSIGREQFAVVINESGLYSLILSSRLPSAKRFKHWITSEVLPSIRKHGAYITDSLLDQIMQRPDVVLQMANVLVQTNAEKEALEEQLQIVQPKADYFDAFVNPDACTNIRNTAKELEIPEKQFIDYLLRHRYLYRDVANRLMPRSQYRQKGWFVLRDVYLADNRMVQQTLFTCRGKDYFRKILKEENVE